MDGRGVQLCLKLSLMYKAGVFFFFSGKRFHTPNFNLKKYIYEYSVAISPHFFTKPFEKIVFVRKKFATF
jgi:hypothetical protein